MTQPSSAREVIARTLHWRGEGRKVTWAEQIRDDGDGYGPCAFYREWADEVIVSLSAEGKVIAAAGHADDTGHASGSSPDPSDPTIGDYAAMVSRARKATRETEARLDEAVALLRDAPSRACGQAREFDWYDQRRAFFARILPESQTNQKGEA